MNDFIPDRLNVLDLLKINMFYIPSYQRPYTWLKEVEELLKDIYDAFMNKSNQLFLGSIYVKGIDGKNANINEYEVIDGQQRIITLALFFAVAYSHLQTNKYDIDNDIVKSIKKIVWKEKHNSNQRDLRVVSSKSIEGNILEDIFNLVYDNPLELDFWINKYKNENLNPVEKNVIEVLELIKKFFVENFADETKFCEVLKFVLHNVIVIFIIVKISRKEIFNIFDAINSKGKKLEEIDLIKSYIFSKIEEENYNAYLKKWGELISETNDKLYDYITIYLRALMRAFKNSLKCDNFKKLLNRDEIINYFQSDEETERIKKLIDDLLLKVKYFKALSNIEAFKKITNKKEHILQFNIFNKLEYIQTKPLIFRALIDYDYSHKTDFDNKNFYNVFQALNSYMFIYQTLNKRDSKASGSFIAELMETNYKSDFIDGNDIRNEVKRRLKGEAFKTKENFDTPFKEIVGYGSSKNTNLGFVILAVIHSFTENDYFSMDNVNSFYESKDNLSIDHILPQTPDINSKYFYYMDKSLIGKDILRLKEGADFPDELVVQEMNYDEFKKIILHKIGNLKFSYKDANSSRGNAEIMNNNENYFIYYKDILKRADDMLEKIKKSDVFYIPLDSNIEDITTKEKDYLTLSFNDPNITNLITGKKPVQVRIFGKPIDVVSNVEMTKAVLGFLYKNKPQKLVNISEGKEGCGTVKTPWITSSPSKLRRKQRIEKSNLYFNANQSAEDFIKMLKKIIVDIYDMNLEDFVVIVK